MKLTTGILILGMAASAWAQNPDEIQNARDTMRAVQQKKQNDSDAALAAGGQSSGPSSSQSSAQPAQAPRTVSIAGQPSTPRGKSKSKVVAVSKSRKPKQT